MGKLTEAQLQFLHNQSIPLSLMFDATGMRKKDYSAAMEENGKAFAFGVSPCQAGGHTIRSRAGHCVQCDTSRIAFMLRHISWGYVYIAESKMGGIIKIGSTTDIQKREFDLRNQAYGMLTDWEITYYVQRKQAGRVEATLQSKIANFKVDGYYLKGGDYQSCYEMFDYSTEEAINLLNDIQ